MPPIQTATPRPCQIAPAGPPSLNPEPRTLNPPLNEILNPHGYTPDTTQMAHPAATSSRRMIEAPTGPSLRIAAIDVGSNSIHMIVAQADADGAITTLWRMKEMVGLGRISFPSHRLSDEAMDRAITTLARYQQAAQQRQ